MLTFDPDIKVDAQNAKDKTCTFTVTFKISEGPQSESVAKSIHDTRSAIQRLNYALKKIAAGYQFDGADATEKINLLKSAADTLTLHATVMTDIFIALSRIKSP